MNPYRCDDCKQNDGECELGFDTQLGDCRPDQREPRYPTNPYWRRTDEDDMEWGDMQGHMDRGRRR